VSLPDVDSIGTYGGALSNYSPVIDPTTDRDAGAMNQALESVAEATHTVARAWARVQLAATGAAMKIVSSDAGWGNASPPVPNHGASAGIFTLQWSPATATITDGLGLTHFLNFRWARATIEGQTFGFANASVTAGNVVTIYMANYLGSPSDFVGTTILVEVG
jgi:hypothetical protein